YPAPLTGAKVIPSVSFAKNALFDAALCANALDAHSSTAPTAPSNIRDLITASSADMRVMSMCAQRGATRGLSACLEIDRGLRRTQLSGSSSRSSTWQDLGRAQNARDFSVACAARTET